MATKVNVQLKGCDIVHALNPEYPYRPKGSGKDLFFRTACRAGRLARDSTPTAAEVDCMWCLVAGSAPYARP
ncbi:MAG TPA: hypothetical protein VF469_09680 [Kofleriaceae bacterium]